MAGNRTGVGSWVTRPQRLGGGSSPASLVLMKAVAASLVLMRAVAVERALPMCSLMAVVGSGRPCWCTLRLTR